MTDRLPPYSPESEQGVLGCLLLDPKECMPVAVAMIGGAEVFYDLRHQLIYNQMVEMFEAGELVDPITLHDRLRHTNILDQVGGMPYVAGLMNVVPSAANIEYYLDIVQRKFTLRQMVSKATKIITDCYSGADEYELLATAEKEILEIGQAQNADDITVKQATIAALNEIEAAFDNKGKIRGLEVGFPDLDWKTFGLKPGNYFVIAARPSVGKTSLAMNMVENVAVDKRIPVGVFSMEMTTNELIHRMICSRARIDSDRAQSGQLDKNEHFAALSAASSRINSAPLSICEKGGLTISQLGARARRMVQREKIKLLVIDYIQLMQGRQRENRTTQMTEISNGIKALAKDLKVPIIVLSQLNRDVEKQDRSPRMSDLRDTGSIEQDADIILLLDPKTEKDGNIPDRQEVDALIPKVRGGRVGFIKLWFNRPITRFESATYRHDCPT